MNTSQKAAWFAGALHLQANPHWSFTSARRMVQRQRWICHGSRSRPEGIYVYGRVQDGGRAPRASGIPLRLDQPAVPRLRRRARIEKESEHGDARRPRIFRAQALARADQVVKSGKEKCNGSSQSNTGGRGCRTKLCANRRREKLDGSKSHTRSRHHGLPGGIHCLSGWNVLRESSALPRGGGIDRSFYLGLPKG